MNRQEEKTQEAIFKAFFSLLSKKSFQKIRIGELTNEANIGRSTFYSHFSSKDDLLTAVCHHLFEHVFITSSFFEHQPDEISTVEKLEHRIAHLFQHFKENEEKITTLYHLEDDYFLRSLKEELDKNLVPLLAPIYFQDSALPNSLITQYISETFISVLNWWLHIKDDVSTTQLTNYYLQLLR